MFQNIPKTCVHTFRAVRKDSRTPEAHRGPPLPAHRSPGGATGTGAPGLPVVLPGSRPTGGSPSTTAGHRPPVVRLRFYPSYLVLGGSSSARIHKTLSPGMITAKDLSPGLPGLILRAEGYIHTQQKLLGNPGKPEGANWAISSITLHWCRDQDAHAVTCVYRLKPVGLTSSFLIGVHNG